MCVFLAARRWRGGWRGLVPDAAARPTVARLIGVLSRRRMTPIENCIFSHFRAFSCLNPRVISKEALGNYSLDTCLFAKPPELVI